jgi:ferredoxin
VERFAARAVETPAGGERSFELVLAGSGVTVQVPPDRTVFEMIEDAGVSVLGSCMEGICGTCEQAVLEGEVDHRDSILNDAERAANDAMMVCVSRCRSDRLVLDL